MSTLPLTEFTPPVTAVPAFCPTCGQPRLSPFVKTGTARPLLLVVDDERPVLRVIERMAGKAGFDVIACASGGEALHALMRQPVDLAMVDLRMPDVNGLDLLRQIRAAIPACEVILMTGYAAVDSAVEAIKLGAREYLTKPFDFDRLRQVLTEIREELDRRARLLAPKSSQAANQDAEPRSVVSSVAPPAMLGELERGHILRVLEQVRGNRMAAAKVLGISRRALYRRLQRHQIVEQAPPTRRMSRRSS